jgi:hypothetical protein
MAARATGWGEVVAGRSGRLRPGLWRSTRAWSRLLQGNWGECHLALERVAAKQLLATLTTGSDSHVTAAVSRFMASRSQAVILWPISSSERPPSPTARVNRTGSIAGPAAVSHTLQNPGTPTRLVSLSAPESVSLAIGSPLLSRNPGRYQFHSIRVSYLWLRVPHARISRPCSRQPPPGPRMHDPG